MININFFLTVWTARGGTSNERNSCEFSGIFYLKVPSLAVQTVKSDPLYLGRIPRSFETFSLENENSEISGNSAYLQFMSYPVSCRFWSFVWVDSTSIDFILSKSAFSFVIELSSRFEIVSDFDSDSFRIFSISSEVCWSRVFISSWLEWSFLIWSCALRSASFALWIW